jgi:hypothetical protein
MSDADTIERFMRAVLPWPVDENDPGWVKPRKSR